jgi:hypothetical protein
LSELKGTRAFEKVLRSVSGDMNRDQYMLMEYLVPVIDGCRAALKVSVDRARELHNMPESEFEQYLEGTEQSFRALTICFRISDTGEVCSIEFEQGVSTVYDECVEPDVVVASDFKTIADLFDYDSHSLPTDVLGSKVEVTGSDSLEVVEALGLLCFPPLMRMARSGIDPSSLEVEDADSAVMSAASGLVTDMVRKWINRQIGPRPDTGDHAKEKVTQGRGKGRRAP